MPMKTSRESLHQRVEGRFPVFSIHIQGKIECAEEEVVTVAQGLIGKTGPTRHL